MMQDPEVERKPTVFVIDDEPTMRDSLKFLLQSIGLSVECSASAAEFLAVLDPGRPGCIVSDVRMPGMSGLELLDQLRSRGMAMPLILITAHADVPMAVRALKAGAVDFIEKPFNDQVLLDSIQKALEDDGEARARESAVSEVRERLATLTPREREVLDLVVTGELSKVIASELGVSLKTVEAHRAKIMEKMKAESLAQLVTMVLRAEPDSPPALT